MSDPVSTADPPASLEARELEHGYRDSGFRLRLPELRLDPGTCTVLLGPNGAGKSTLLSLLSGLEEPEAGAIRWAGGDHAPLGRVTLVHQRVQLPRGSVDWNLRLASRLAGRGIPDDASRALKTLGIVALAHQSVQTLSGGERKMVALARALSIRPELLLLDEPTSDLDPARTARIEKAVLEARDQEGTCILWATHNLFQARRVADRVLFLHEGTLVEHGPAGEFFGSPRDERTRRFLRGELLVPSDRPAG